MKGCFVKKLCTICGREISAPNYERHLQSHANNPKKFNRQSVQHEGLNCIYCGKECKNKNSLAQHECRCKANPKHYLIPDTAFGGISHRAPWNKGLTKDTDERVKKNTDNVIKHIQTYGSWWQGKHHTDETKHKLAMIQAGNTNGNRSKKGYYKGIWCGSSYELAYLIYCLEHNIGIERCTEYFEYVYKNTKHLYFPDFIVDNTIIEIKGYHTELVDIKTAAVDKPVKVLYKQDLKDILDYVINKYGKDFIKLYDSID